ncbi:MAG: hypothetical protein KF893_11990 [Caldilineaceae bacterium]|nr:hypothetical protein [Caldilineaceae bacterium]
MAKLMRAEPGPLSVRQDLAKSFSDFSGAATSSVTILIVPPHNILLEVSDQRLYALKCVVAFSILEMAVIALARFIIIPDDTDLIDYIGQPVFETMSRSTRNRLMHPFGPSTPRTTAVLFGDGYLGPLNPLTQMVMPLRKDCLRVQG